MGVTDGWWKYGCAAVVGIDTYGESAPASALFKHFGFTPENVADAVRKVLSYRAMALSPRAISLSPRA
jgi:transketolase